MDEPIRPRASVPTEHKPRMRPLLPGSRLAPCGQRWLCHLPKARVWGTGHTQREAWEAAHGVPVYQRDGWEWDARSDRLPADAPDGWPVTALARMLERGAGRPG